MIKNQLGTTEIFISELGFGSMSLSSSQNDNENMIQSALDQGINFFDTADLYDKGFNEESLGKAIRDVRHDIILASKGGNEWEEGKDSWKWNPTKSYLKEAIKKSLHRLQTDYLDLYQLHGGTIDDPYEETIEAFNELKKEGTIRAYGISSIRPNVIKRFIEHADISSIMMQYSILDRRPEEWFSLMENHDISILARGPVAKGLLTSHFEKKLEGKEFLSFSNDELGEALLNIKSIAAKENLTMEQLALRFVMDQSAITSAVAGASSIDQLMKNISSTKSPSLSQETITRIKKVIPALQYESHRD